MCSTINQIREKIISSEHILWALFFERILQFEIQSSTVFRTFHFEGFFLEDSFERLQYNDQSLSTRFYEPFQTFFSTLALSNALNIYNAYKFTVNLCGLLCDECTDNCPLKKWKQNALSKNNPELIVLSVLFRGAFNLKVFKSIV